LESFGCGRSSVLSLARKFSMASAAIDPINPPVKDLQINLAVASVDEKHSGPADFVYDKSVAILQKDPSLRTDEDIDFLYKWLQTLKIHLVHEHSPELIKELCRTMKFERVAANQTVMKQGDVANKLYIIIKGSVSLYVINDHRDMEYPDPVQHTLAKFQQMMSNAVSTPSIQKMAIEKTLASGTPIRNRASLRIDTAKAMSKEAPVVNETPEQRRLRVQTNPCSPKVNKARRSLDQKVKQQEIFIGFIRAGGPKTSFGELALIANTTRSATIRTDLQDCEFLVIEKGDFDRVLKARLGDLLEQKVNKMKQFRIFQNMSDVHLQKISLHLESRTFGPKQMIAKQNNPATHLYFVVSGDCETVQISHEDPVAAVEKRHSLRNHQTITHNRVALLRPFHTFGEREALSEPLRPYQYGLRSVTDCEMWMIERGEFLRRTRGDIVEELLSDETKEKDSPATPATPGTPGTPSTPKHDEKAPDFHAAAVVGSAPSDHKAPANP